MDDVAIWVQAGATLALLGVTGYYAAKTKSMADSAEKAVKESMKATKAAKRSAYASRDAARVAQSQIEPHFTGRRVAARHVSDHGHTACIRIESTGDAVVVKGVRILRAFRRSTLRDSVSRVDIQNEDMEPWGLDTILPKRLHAGENILVTHLGLQDARKDPLEYFILLVEYAFDEDDHSRGTRQLKIDDWRPDDLEAGE